MKKLHLAIIAFSILLLIGLTWYDRANQFGFYRLYLVGIVAVLWFTWMQYKSAWQDFINWLRVGADSQDSRRQDFVGNFDEAAAYVERLLLTAQHQQNQRTNQLELLHNAVQAIPNGVILLDKKQRIEWMNPKAAEYLGLDSQIDRMQQLSNLVRYPELISYLAKEKYDQPLLLNSHSHLNLSLQFLPYSEDYSLVLLQDITQIERLDKMRRDFVANVSHEIRTPLTVLSGFIETLTDLPLEPQQQQQYLQLMQQQAQRMQVLVADLLALAKLEEGKTAPTDQWVGVASIFQQVQSVVKELSAGQHKFQFEQGVDAQIAGIDSELVSALANIAINAVRYTAVGGKIKMSWQVMQSGELIFQVQDNGEGIASKHLARLTERFYRVDRSRSRQTGGTGLGLSIVKHVLLRHDGYLDIASQEGNGSTFSLHYPATRVRLLD